MKEIIRGAAAVAGGLLSFLFGGLDDLLAVLTVLICLDYVSGVIKGIYRHELSSAVSAYTYGKNKNLDIKNG
uniref:phage holin family protein n=1 Tax=Eubacterium maltosivorans TaxID=2041044 RepID=UPI003A8D920A